jgi:hypothetical protein
MSGLGPNYGPVYFPLALHFFAKVQHMRDQTG